jgi:NADH-quinone oxidoreductase subunit C
MNEDTSQVTGNVERGGLLKELGGIEAWARAECDHDKTGIHASFFLHSERLLSAARLLLDRGCFLECISGVDVEEGVMLAYHFERFDRSERLVLRIMVPQNDKRAPSLASVYTGADWHERECFDFFGVAFDGHPNLKPLLLPDDLGVNPLVKEQGRKSLRAILPMELMVDAKP